MPAERKKKKVTDADGCQVHVIHLERLDRAREESPARAGWNPWQGFSRPWETPPGFPYSPPWPEARCASATWPRLPRQANPR